MVLIFIIMIGNILSCHLRLYSCILFRFNSYHLIDNLSSKILELYSIEFIMWWMWCQKCQQRVVSVMSGVSAACCESNLRQLAAELMLLCGSVPTVCCCCHCLLPQQATELKQAVHNWAIHYYVYSHHSTQLSYTLLCVQSLQYTIKLYMTTFNYS